MWPVLPPILEQYRGESYRVMFGYDGPSMMDGVQTSDNDQDDGLRVWNEHVAMVEALG